MAPDQSKLDRYLVEIIRNVLKLDPTATMELAELIKQMIKWGDWGDIPAVNLSSHPNHHVWFDTCKNKLNSYGPIAVYPLLGYETVCWRGPTTQPNSFPINVAAQIMGYHAPNSYHTIEDMLVSGIDGTTSQFYRQNFGNPSTPNFRYRFDVMSIVFKMALPPVDWWPDKDWKVSSWAESKLHSMHRYFQDDPNMVSEVDFILGSLRETKENISRDFARHLKMSDTPPEANQELSNRKTKPLKTSTKQKATRKKSALRKVKRKTKH